MGLLERLKEGGECDGTAGVIKGRRECDGTAGEIKGGRGV